MAWIAQFDTQMLRDGYTLTEAMIYGYLWWTTWKTEIQEEITPSIWLIKKTLNLSKRTIIRWIDKLEKEWLIEVYRFYKEKNTYFVIDMYNYPACYNFNPDMMVNPHRKKSIKSKFYGAKMSPGWCQNVTR